jgi:hypothetical protein
MPPVTVLVVVFWVPMPMVTYCLPCARAQGESRTSAAQSSDEVRWRFIRGLL